MQSLAPDSPDSTDAEEERTSKTSTAQPTDEQATHAPDKDRIATRGAKSDTKADAERPKAQGQQVTAPTASPVPPAMDLMAALKASLERTKAIPPAKPPLEGETAPLAQAQ